jgi:hypothetical protein
MAASATDADAGAGLRSEFLQVLLSRRRDLLGQVLSHSLSQLARVLKCSALVVLEAVGLKSLIWLGPFEMRQIITVEVTT